MNCFNHGVSFLLLGVWTWTPFFLLGDMLECCLSVNHFHDSQYKFTFKHSHGIPELRACAEV